MEELIGSMDEPCSLRMDIRTEAMDAAVDDVLSIMTKKVDPALVEEVKGSVLLRTEIQDREWDRLVDRLIEIAGSPNLNWRYVLWACKLLYAILRKDRPIDTRIAKFFVDLVQNAHPRIRDYGISYVRVGPILSIR
jgi:proteasome activator subunit 4